MAISAFKAYTREGQIIDKLKSERGDRTSRLRSISGILTDMKQSSGRWTIAFLLKWLYRDSMGDLKKDLARAALISNELEQPSVDKFKVLTALWPAISRLAIIEDSFFRLVEDMRLNAKDFYENERI